jgi:hypothetical protein
MPMSQMMSWATSDWRIFANASQEWSVVSPGKNKQISTSVPARKGRNLTTFKEVIEAAITTDARVQHMVGAVSHNEPYVISSSGPERSFAPRSFAILMLSRIRSKFPPKSSAHWFSEQAATVMRCPLGLNFEQLCCAQRSSRINLPIFSLSIRLDSDVKR